MSLSLSHWCLGSCVVLDCIDSWSLHPYLLCCPFKGSDSVVVVVGGVNCSYCVCVCVDGWGRSRSWFCDVVLFALSRLLYFNCARV